MIEILKIMFNNFWTFIGSIILLVVIFEGIQGIIEKITK